MKREISPVVAIVVVVVIVVLAGGFFLMSGRSSSSKKGANGMNAQSSGAPIPAQTFIPKASGN